MNKIFLPVKAGTPVTQVYGAVGQTNFYNTHYGIDYGASCGDPIYCCDSGVVVYAGWASGYGNLVKIQHEWGYSLYAHQSFILVDVGQEVIPSKVLGNVGTTGMSTGCHLHFECRDTSDRVFDQTNYITDNLNEVIDMKLSLEQVRKWYLAILRRECETGCPYVGAEMSELALAYELAESREHTQQFDTPKEFEQVAEQLYRKK